MPQRRATWLILVLALGLLLGLGLGLTIGAARVSEGAATPRPAPRPAPRPTPRPAWTPQIAMQYYDTAGIDPRFLAEHIDWLMMRYGAEGLRDQVLALGYDNVLPQYLQLAQIYGPGPYKGSHDKCRNNYTPLQNNVMWTDDFCQQVHPHEDWFLHDSQGERLYTKERIWDGSHAYQYFMNPGSPGFREFWVDQVRRQRDAGWQSFFLDNVAATYAYIGQRADDGDGSVAEYASVGEWQQAVSGMLRSIRENFPQRQIWANLISAPLTADAWDAYRPELDGIQEENFATSWLGSPALTLPEWDAMLTRAERTLADGKSVVLYGQGEQNDFPRMRFALASYLLVATANQRATFRYTYTRNYDVIWWYPEYEAALGAPSGPRYAQDGLWARDFACARVWADPARQDGGIERRPCEE